jgi:pimeloyl-ACP methyl ester carboxylesterase
MEGKNFEIEVGWGQISGQIFGDPNAPNSKPILALHGFLDNSNSFRPLAPFLTQSNEYYLIAIDLPGMGFSSKIPNGIPYTTKFFVMSLRRVVLHFNLSKFLFLCHSFGCSLALAVINLNFKITKNITLPCLI